MAVWASFVGVVLVGILVVITWRYERSTEKILREMQRQARISSRALDTMEDQSRIMALSAMAVAYAELRRAIAQGELTAARKNGPPLEPYMRLQDIVECLEEVLDGLSEVPGPEASEWRSLHWQT